MSTGEQATIGRQRHFLRDDHSSPVIRICGRQHLGIQFRARFWATSYFIPQADPPVLVRGIVRGREITDRWEEQNAGPPRLHENVLGNGTGREPVSSGVVGASGSTGRSEERREG